MTDMDKNPFVSVIIVSYNRKDECLECVDSVLRSNYSPLEVIAVDNASIDNTYAALEERYAAKIKLVRSEKNIYAAGGRNLGARYASGEYLLFIDSDNVIDKEMITYLIEGIRENKELKIGIAGPFTYYKSDRKRLCWLNNSISLVTSHTAFTGAGAMDDGQYQYQNLNYITVGHMPNVFMLKKDLFSAVGGIDSDYVMHYEESDLAEKVKRQGYSVVLFPKAKTWHDLPLRSVRGHKSFTGINTAMVYYVSRNRVIFMRKNSKGIRLLLFLVLFSNLFLIYNLAVLIMNGKFSLITLVFKGYADGLSFSIKPKNQ